MFVSEIHRLCKDVAHLFTQRIKLAKKFDLVVTKIFSQICQATQGNKVISTNYLRIKRILAHHLVWESSANSNLAIMTERLQELSKENTFLLSRNSFLKNRCDAVETALSICYADLDLPYDYWTTLNTAFNISVCDF